MASTAKVAAVNTVLPINPFQCSIAVNHCIPIMSVPINLPANMQTVAPI